MRTINEIVVHCSATEAGKDFGAADIDRWHKAQGWNGIGYHYVVKLDGTIEKGRDESVVGSHVAGHNANSIGVVYIGGVKGGKPADTRTFAQKASLFKVLSDLRKKYPKAKILGHRDFPKVAKACPSFDVGAWLKCNGIDP